MMFDNAELEILLCERSKYLMYWSNLKQDSKDWPKKSERRFDCRFIILKPLLFFILEALKSFISSCCCWTLIWDLLLAEFSEV